MSNEDSWKDITVESPPYRTELEWWDDYSERVFSGELYQYDGKYVRVGMRHWHMEIPLYDFTHWRKRSRNPAGEIPE